MYLSNLSEVSVTQKTAQQKIGLKDGEGNKSPGHHWTKKSTVTFQHTLSGPRETPMVPHVTQLQVYLNQIRSESSDAVEKRSSGSFSGMLHIAQQLKSIINNEKRN